MNKRTVAYLLILLIILSSLFLGAGALNARERRATKTPEVSAQLQEVIQNQQLIISKLDEMKEQLRIIKIRATR